jgi:DNA processing protein
MSHLCSFALIRGRKRIPGFATHIKLMAQPACANPFLTDDDQIHWLALRMATGLGTRKAGQLIATFRTPQAIFQASRSELTAAGLAPAVAQSIASGCAFEDAVTQKEKLLQAGAELLPITDPRYPPRLKEIFDPPPLLYVRGRVDLLGSLMLAIVGTRRPTAYGIAAATRLSQDLATAGLTIVSGMARGIDSAAHRAALDRQGDTVAVFGCGVDELYPVENRKLAKEIGDKGLIISEFPMGTPPYPQNFPVRNRIVSGMCVGVLVVEGGEYSGSAITAKLAAEHNREIFAVPGNITSKMSWGPNLLIKQGAKLVQEWNDVVTELSAEDRRRLADRFRKQLNINEIQDPVTSEAIAASYSTEPMKAVQRAVLAALAPDSPVSLDRLIDTLPGCSTSEVIAVLFDLEMTGLVRQLPGKNFLKVWAE